MASVTVKDKSKDRKKRKDKGKEKITSKEFVEDSGEELEQSEGYQPPDGYVPFSNHLDDKEFDYDNLKEDDDLELWVVRVPKDVKTKHLENLKISLPSSSKTCNVGTLSRKNVEYDIWSIRDDGSDQTPVVGGDEVLGLNCLVPRRKKGGKLFNAPKPVAHHLVLTAKPALPTPPTSECGTPAAVLYQGPPRYQHPKHLLKHRFLPCGTIIEPSETTVEKVDVEASGAEADVLPVEELPDVVEKTAKKEAKVGKDRTEKRRKGDDSPKKSKKLKVAS